MSYPFGYRLLFQLQPNSPRPTFSRSYGICYTSRVFTADATATRMDEFGCVLYADHHQSLVVSYSTLRTAFHRRCRHQGTFFSLQRRRNITRGKAIRLGTCSDLSSVHARHLVLGHDNIRGEIVYRYAWYYDCGDGL